MAIVSPCKERIQRYIDSKKGMENRQLVIETFYGEFKFIISVIIYYNNNTPQYSTILNFRVYFPKDIPYTFFSRLPCFLKLFEIK